MARRRKHRRWTAKEDRVLRRRYPREGAAAVAEVLGRSRAAVKMRVVRLGLRTDRGKWKAAEIAYLRAHYGRERTRTIAARLGRTAGQVCQAAKRLGLSRPGPRRWTRRETAYLRRHLREPLAALAATLRRTEKAIKSRCKVLGLARTDRHVWSRQDLRALRRRYGREPAPQIAAELGISVQKVRAAAGRIGLTRTRPRMTRRIEAAIRRGNAAGRSDVEIAGPLGMKRQTVGAWRRRLGLPHQAHSDRQRRRVAATTRRRVAEAGCGSLAELKAVVIAARGRRLGWPEDLRWRAVQVLETLWLLGPMTRRRLADEIGMPWKGQRQSLHSNDPEGSYLAHLMARGLVVHLGRCVPRDGRGRNVYLYSLPIGVAPARADSGSAVPGVWAPKSILDSQSLTGPGSARGSSPAQGGSQCREPGKPKSSRGRRGSRPCLRPAASCRRPTSRASTRAHGRRSSRPS